MKKPKIQEDQLQKICEALYIINKEAKQKRDKRTAIKRFLFNYASNKEIVQEYELSIGKFNQYSSILPANLSWKGDYILFSDYHIEELYDPIQRLLKKAPDKSKQILINLSHKLSKANNSLSYLHEDLQILYHEIEGLYELKNKAISQLIKLLKLKPIAFHQFPALDVRPCYEINQFSFHGKEITRNLSKIEFIKLNHEISSKNLLNITLSLEDAKNILCNFLDNK